MKGLLSSIPLLLVGALAATGLGRHLSIDLAAALLPHRWTTWLGRITSVFAAVVCILLAWAAGRYVGFQRDMEMTMLLGMADNIAKTAVEYAEAVRKGMQALLERGMVIGPVVNAGRAA